MLSNYLRKLTWDEWRGSLDGVPTLWIKQLFSFRGFKISLHKMVGADAEGCFHTHPANAYRLILAGGYIEELLDGTLKTWLPGSFGKVPFWYSHRIASIVNTKESYSVWMYRDWETDRKSTRLNSSHEIPSRMPSSA